jgi:hypothetical protein
LRTTLFPFYETPFLQTTPVTFKLLDRLRFITTQH